ncbi:MAG: translation initiation factor IF-2 [Acidobacteria bacterium]|nr:translation initiation factor IF-2 [Acidobacteriota bacterium]
MSTVRIFQLAQELNIDSAELMDALDDMGVPAKSNLASLEESVVADLRELFKPKPKPKAPAASSAKEEAVRRAIAEREARERAAEDAARREEERKAEARRQALERAARRRQTAPKGAAGAPAEDAARLGPEIPSGPPVSTAAEPAAAALPGLDAVAKAQPAPIAPAGAAPPAAEWPAPAPPVAPAPPPPPARHAPPAPTSRLGRAVIAPPPATAKERAELLGRPLSQMRSTGAAPARRTPSTPGAGRGATGSMPGAGTARRPHGPAHSARPQPSAAPTAPRRPVEAEPPVGEVKISEGISIKDLAERMNRKAKDIITRLFLQRGVMATINHALDEETARWVVDNFGGTVMVVGVEEEALAEAMSGQSAEAAAQAAEKKAPRAPVVTFMGHVDHGKTSLLDAIRKTRVAEREAGGITQHIGAYKVKHRREGLDREIVFLDTPGHEAFTMMRSRGARVTDIVVLVVAADDGVMPQTIEAINHAKAAAVPLVVAVNKVDKPGARPERVKQQLADRGVLVEDFGGDVVAVDVSAKALTGIDNLLEMILLVTDLQELGANPDVPAAGTVLEAKLDKARGPIATVLVQNGTLRVGDVFVVGSLVGRVRALVDEHEKRVTKAEPSTPVVVMGLEDVPQAGDTLQVFPDEQRARQIALYRQTKRREEEAARRTKLPTLETLHQQIKEGDVSELAIVVKADVQGSVEVLRKSIEDLSTPEVTVRVIHSGTGAISETDILLASASRAIVVGFNVRPDRGVADVAREEGVDIRLHTVIYNVTEEIKKAMLAQLSPVEKEVALGRVEVRQVFRIAKIGVVAGCYVTDGVVRRDAQVRLLRDNVVIHTGKISTLRRFKDDAREVRSGFECGIALERYQDLKPGDELEAFTIEMTRRESLDPSAAS